MPFASEKQRRYMESQEPEVAAKWHAEGKAYVKGKKKKRVKKNAKGWLQPVAIGATGGALANQLPSYEEQQRLRANRKRREKKVKPVEKSGGFLVASARYHTVKPKKRSSTKRKGVAKALAAPTWPEDEFFNAKAAQAAYDLVMKMDDDAAEMFTTMVVSTVMEADIEANRATLQKHLNEVIAKRLADLKRATIRVVAKGGDPTQQIGFAQAVAILEEISQPQAVSKVKTPYDYGYVFSESAIRRDPGSGQFQTKIKHTQKQPIQNKVAGSMGILPHPTGEGRGKGAFTPEQKAQYQDEYRQLANFMQSVYRASPNPGETQVDLHFEDQAGNQWIERPGDTRAKPDMLDPRDRTLRGVTAYPTGLNVGGTAFGLAGALGGGMRTDRIDQINQGAAQMPQFAQDWTKDYGSTDTNARLYGRMGAGGAMLSAVAPAGSKAQLAGHFGTFVGQYGPQAEAVIGPPARRTAYRYRGTEKKPDREMVRAYETAVRASTSNRGFDEEAVKRNKIAQNRALKAKALAVAEETNTPIEAVRLTPEQRTEAMNSVRQAVAPETGPSWEEQKAGHAEIADYLRREPTDERGGAAPKKGLYNLQLASGNTPPSEGVILDRDGQIVSQAIGYGDDHYLPFNLKNLKSLKGGSYIRNRSVGGLTSEDIYTGLISGARSVTVVSRSGTFTMEFEPDFRGGRRHNDKAMRMTRRYEQLLDAVQSEQVEREQVDPDIRRVITQKVEADPYSRVMTGADKRAEVKRRIDEYKSSPDMDEETQEYIDLIVNNRTQGMTSPDRGKIKAQVLNDVARNKEYKFRLNGAGYADALEGLREQFPYYITVNSVPTKELERHETEPDLGYVEPGRIRPTAAAAGLFGGAKEPSFARAGGKVSAARADYASPYVPPATKEPAKEAEGETTTEGEPQKEGTTPAVTTVGEVKEQAKYEDAAVALQQALREHADITVTDETRWAKMEESDFRAYLQNKENQAKFDHWVTVQTPEMVGKTVLTAPLTGYSQASGRIGRKPYERVLSQHWAPKPYAFPNGGKAYEAGADDATRHKELRRIKADRVGVVNLKPVSQMTDKELEQEVIAVAQVRRILGGLTGQPTFEEKKEAFQGVNLDSPMLQSVFAGGDDTMDDYLEMVHRTRAVNAGVPDAERGWKEERLEQSVPAEQAAEETASIEERRDRIAYQAGKALEHFEQDTEEHDQLAQLKMDLEMQRDRIRTPKALEGVRNAGTNAQAYDLIQRLIHEGKITDYEHAKGKGQTKKPKELGSGSGGPILI